MVKQLNVKNLIMKAGAGAGKTTALVRRFAAFVRLYRAHNQGKYPRIVVTTFTKKATQELKERILQYALKRNDHELFQFVGKKSFVQISTIHGVLSLFLSRYGQSIGLNPDYQIVDEQKNRRLHRKVLRNVILSQPEYSDLLVEYQFSELDAALQEWLGGYIFYPDFAPISVAELKNISEERVVNFCLRGQRLGASFANGTVSPSFGIVVELLNKIPVNKERQTDYLKNFIEQSKGARTSKLMDPLLVEEFNEWKKELKKEFEDSDLHQPALWQKVADTNIVFQKLASEYSKILVAEKLQTGQISMADLEPLALLLIRQDPESAKSFSAEWDYWMIDEYQDTSPLQVEILKALVGDRSQYVVGDPQQSIYLFRGARSEVFHQKMTELGRVRLKMSNYRSRPIVLECINKIFSNDTDFEPMVPKSSKFTLAATDEPAKAFILTEEQSLPDVTLAEAKSLIDQGVAPEKICILVRTKSIFQGLSEAAIQQGVELQIHGQSGFQNRREILDLIQITKFLANPADNQNLLSVLRSPWFFMSDEHLVQLARYGDKNYWKALGLLATNNSGFEEIYLKLKSYLSRLNENGFSQTLNHIISECGPIQFAHQLDPSGRREANVWKYVSMLSQQERQPGFNIFQFLENLGTVAQDADGADEGDAVPVIQPSRVNVMTIHKSKGLQFDYVLLPQCGSAAQKTSRGRGGGGGFYIDESSSRWSLEVIDPEEGKKAPNLFSLEVIRRLNDREMKESKRLFYVGVTRAKEKIIFLSEAKAKSDAWIHYLDFLKKDSAVELKSEIQIATTRNDIRLRNRYVPSTAKSKLEHVSVTSLVERFENKQSANNKKADSSTQNLVQSLKIAQKGTDAHRLFETLKYSGFDGLARFQISDEDQLAVNYLQKCTEVPMQKIFESGFAEWGFALKKYNKVLQGQIDLWGQVGEKLWVIDYKTGSSAYATKAISQLKVYAWALGQMNQINSHFEIKLAAIFPMEEKVFVETVSFKDLEFLEADFKT